MTATSTMINLHTDTITFSFTPNNGSLCCIVKENDQWNILDGEYGNWQLVLADGDHCIDRRDFANCSVQTSDNSLICTWDTPVIDGLPPSLMVRVTWQITDTLLTGRIMYRTDEHGLQVKQIHFPMIAFEEQANASLVLPRELGIMCHDAGNSVFHNGDRHNQTGWQYLHGGSMQFSAYIADNKGFYFDTRDTAGYLKSACFMRGHSETTVIYRGTHLVPQTSEGLIAYELPYPVNCSVFGGDWYAAAMIYRSWALQQPWAIKAREHKNSSTAERIRRLAVWCWNRGTIQDVVPPVERLAAELGMPIGLDWYWWHQHAYDTSYPRYLPPREGSGQFSAAVARLKQQDVYTQVYINGMLRDMDDVSWADHGKQSVIIKENGDIYNEVFNTYMGHRLAFVCGSSVEWREIITQVARSIAELGLGGLYLDVIARACGHSCFSPEHHHPSYGGTYQVDGFRKLFQSIREQCPELALSSEGCNESFIDILDTCIMLDSSWERTGFLAANEETIPLFSAVYHGLFPLFGSYALPDGNPPYDPLWPPAGEWKYQHNWKTECPDQFFVEIARNIVWGLQPTVANLRIEHMESPDYTEEREFLLAAVKTYYHHRDFLLDGTMLPPGQLNVEYTDIKFLKRMIFTKEGEQEIHTRHLPGVLHSCWQSADGRRMLVLANYTRQQQRYSYDNLGESLAGTIDPRSFHVIEF